MKRYDPAAIEPKWQKSWEQSKIYQASEDTTKPKKYVLEYFPYPSGAAMHVGHVRNYAIGDVISRYYRMNGYNVLHPMGWDAFGLPAENFAIKNNVSPRVAIDQNTSRFKQQLIQMGFSYDWSREIDSTDPNYYRWTQWFFLLLFKKGLAYQKDSLQWWCPVDKTVLANEQVENGKCWRCGSPVEKKALKQWFFRITDYAERLLSDLDDLDWSHAIKTMQRNWIGKSNGTRVQFSVEGMDENIEVFTTAIDTIYGVTFMVLAPEHELVQKITTDEHHANVNSYIQQSQAKSEIERQDEAKEKTGTFTGAHAINPANGQKIPIWIADYVLAGYGTGAIMAVPGEDLRDYEFASKYELPIVYTTEAQEFINYQTDIKASPDKYKMANSGEFSGLSFKEGRQKIIDKLEKENVASSETQYKMRDWLISRQRYWGAPIPIIHCEKDGAVAVPEDQLPVLLPEIDSYEPSGDGRSPLANDPDFVNTTCPKCGVPATRETDTMDGFACSSWYFLRFTDPDNALAAFSKDKAEFWLPVDDYIGGAEHAVMHLLYARFWTKVMYDEGLVNFEEPFTTLRNQGMILAPDGEKMSKSKGNTIEPDILIDQGYGADSIRLMELFIGPWDQASAWSTSGVSGTYRFLNRIWTLVQEYLESTEAEDSDPEVEQAINVAINKTIKKVTQDLNELSFNTAISALMELTNDLYKLKQSDKFKSKTAWTGAVDSLVLLLAPFAPHVSEELWSELGHKDTIHLTQWPKHDETYLKSDQVTIVVQINGKLRASLLMPVGSSEDEVKSAAFQEAKVETFVKDKEIKKVIYIQDKLINIVAV
jgi:leucyl-tRNA synthetase